MNLHNEIDTIDCIGKRTGLKIPSGQHGNIDKIFLYGG